MIQTVYIIHLERETARESNILEIKKHIIKLNNNINFIIYPAIDKNILILRSIEISRYFIDYPHTRMNL